MTNNQKKGRDNLLELSPGLRQAVQATLNIAIHETGETRAMAAAKQVASDAMDVHVKPSRSTLNSTDAATARGRAASTRRRRAWLGMALAASVALAAFALPEVFTNHAFAEVQKAIAGLSSITFRATPVPDESIRSKVTITESRKARVEMDGGKIIVADIAAGKSVLVDPANKSAIIFSGLQTEPSIDFFRVLRDIKSDSVKKIAAKKIGGQSFPGFRFGDATLTYRLWVDPATKLPVYGESGAEGGPTDLQMDEFVFNAPTSADAFKIVAPEGYAVTKRTVPPAGSLLASKQLTLTPLKGLGAVEFGMTQQEIVGAFGNAQETQTIDQTGGTLLLYDHLGVRLTLNPAGQLDDITCNVNNEGLAPLAATFGGTTDKGIAMTASGGEIIEAYGKPDYDREHRSKAADGKSQVTHRILGYFKLGLEFRLQNDSLTYLSAGKSTNPKCYPTQE